MDSRHCAASESTESSTHCVGHDTEGIVGHNMESTVSEYCVSDLQPHEELPGTPLGALPLVELNNTVNVQDNGKSEMDVSVKSKKVRQRFWTVILSAVVACIPFLLVGCTLGFPSGALLDLTDLEDRPDFKLSRELAIIFGALGYVGAVFGGPIAGWISDRMGRKPALMLVSVPYLIGYMMLAYAHLATNGEIFKAILLIGRFFSGVGLGWSSLAVTVYVTEISPAKRRGNIGSILPTFLSLGVLIAYGLSSIEGFRYSDSSIVLIGFVALFTVSMTFFCETPQWLLANGQKKRAIAALKFLRGPNYDVKKEVEIIQANVDSSPRLKPSQVLLEFARGSVIVPVIIVLFLVIFLQCGGLDSVIVFSASILKNAGVQNFRQIAAYGTGGTRLFVSIIVVFLSDFLGRKVLLVMSGIGTFIGTTLLGAHFYITRSSACFLPINSSNITSPANVLTNVGTAVGSDGVACNVEFAPLAIVALVVYNVGFSIGWGSVIWLLIGELLPLQVRGVATGIATFTIWSLAAVIIGAYDSYASAVQPWFAWWTYSLVNFLSIVFVIFCIFETKGKSLEEIQHKFESSKYGQKNMLSICKSVCPLVINKKQLN